MVKKIIENRQAQLDGQTDRQTDISIITHIILQGTRKQLTYKVLVTTVDALEHF